MRENSLRPKACGSFPKRIILSRKSSMETASTGPRLRRHAGWGFKCRLDSRLPMPALGELARPARKAPTRFFVGGADCNLHFFVTDLAENISLKEITTEFTGRAPVENTHFTPIIAWIH